MGVQAKSLFDYIDYRVFLREYYESRKAENPHFSFRYIADKLGFDSGYFAKIIQAERHISLKLAARFVEFLKLGKREAEYFEAMILFAKAKTHEQKRRCLDRLLAYKEIRIPLVSKDQYELFDKWYYLAIRELIACMDFRGDCEELAARLVPAIRPSEAKRAIALLSRLGLIRKGRDGIYHREAPVLSSGAELRSVALVNLHKSTLELAQGAFDRFPQAERNMSTLTLSVSKAEYEAMVADVAALRKRLLDAAARCRAPDRVYHLNINIFPLCRPPKGGG